MKYIEITLIFKFQGLASSTEQYLCAQIDLKLVFSPRNTVKIGRGNHLNRVLSADLSIPAFLLGQTQYELHPVRI